MSIIELRQYTLLPGKRDVLIALFEQEFSEAQEASGIQVIGTFRDLGDDSKFVWLRSFPSMSARAESLREFYGGPVWHEHRDAANATMVDSDDVLLLRPAWDESDFAADPRGGGPADERGLVEAVILRLAEPAATVDFAFFCDEVVPLIQASGAVVLACLTTVQCANNFPVLPVREGQHNIVWFTGRSGQRDDGSRARMIDAIDRWPGALARPHTLRLRPTEHSQLTGASATRFTAIPALR